MNSKDTNSTSAEAINFSAGTSSNYANPYEISPLKYTQAQLWTLTIVMYIAPFLSLLGSMTVLTAIIKGKLNRKGNRAFQPTYVRLLGGFALMDIVQNLGVIVFGNLAVPKDVPWSLLAAGTATTCEVSGFFFNFSSGLFVYSASLALFYVFQIKLEWKDEFIARRVEPWFHLLPWTYATVTGITFVILDGFNPVSSAPGVCWMAPFPAGCQYDETEYECLRGVSLKPLFFTHGAVTSLSFTCISVSFVLIYRKVKATEERLARYTSSHFDSSAANLTMTKKTGTQAMRFIFTYFISIIWINTNVMGPSLVADSATTYYFVNSLLQFLLFPLQGFLHAVIFVQRHPVLRDEPNGPLRWLNRLMAGFKPNPSTKSTPEQEISFSKKESSQNTSPTDSFRFIHTDGVKADNKRDDVELG